MGFIWTIEEPVLVVQLPLWIKVGAKTQISHHKLISGGGLDLLKCTASPFPTTFEAYHSNRSDSLHKLKSAGKMSINFESDCITGIAKTTTTK